MLDAERVVYTALGAGLAAAASLLAMWLKATPTVEILPLTTGEFEKEIPTAARAATLPTT
jgi:hypothetical protein